MNNPARLDAARLVCRGMSSTIENNRTPGIMPLHLSLESVVL